MQGIKVPQAMWQGQKRKKKSPNGKLREITANKKKNCHFKGHFFRETFPKHPCKLDAM